MLNHVKGQKLTTYNDTILLDNELNRVSNILVDYYIKDSYIMWNGYIFNDTVNSIDNCKVVTTSTYDGVFAVSGGAITGYNTITSSLDTTHNLGVISGGSMLPIVLRVCISGGSPLDGLQTAPLYITK